MLKIPMTDGTLTTIIQNKETLDPQSAYNKADCSFMEYQKIH